MTGTCVTLLTLLAIAPTAAAGEWTPLPPLPDRNGFAGPFAGTSGGALLVAGGANFPDKKPWEGGTKVWYDTVFLLDRRGGEWKAVGKLPRPLGYGVPVGYRDGVVCVGGSDADKCYADAFRLEWRAAKLVTTSLPPLPKPLANLCGARVGDLLYVAAGIEKPDATAASNSVYALDLAADEPRWREVEASPGAGRILAVAAACDDAFWIAGGAELVAGNDGKTTRRYLKDVYRYAPRSGWKRAADLPHPLAAAPSPAPADASGFYVLGGDDGSQVSVSPDRHRGFGRTILRYNPQSDRWTEAGELPAGPVTVPVARWGDAWVIPSGEVRPGIRSPQVWNWTPGKQE